MTWHRYAIAGVVLSAPIVATGRVAREGAPPADSARASAGAAGGTVSGTVTLLGGGADVGEAVVYLEPIEAPPAAPLPAPTAPVAPSAGVAAAPRDSVRLLWGAVRELGAVARDLGQRISTLRVGAAPPPESKPSTPALAMIDSAARPPAARPALAAPRPPEPATVVVYRSAESRGEIAMRQKTFTPHVRVVAAGGSVAWPNQDPFSHNVFSNTPGGSFDLGLYPRGESRGAAFQRAGVYAVFCNIHPHMSAYVVAVPSGYYARPGAGGRFEIADVPAGRYRLRAWHERANAPFARVITVGDGGTPGLAIALDARGYRPQPHANKYGQPYGRTTADEY